MMQVLASCGVVAALLLSRWQPMRPHPADQPSAKQVLVNGTTIRYWEQGHGTPVVFVHGAISDHRTWEPQRQAVAARYRFVALDRRYFGTAAWPDSGARHSQATHVADLAAFIRELKLGPAFLVGTSGGAQVALVMAVQHPELVRALFVHEPGLRSILTDASDRRLVSASDEGRAAPRAAAKAGKMAEAAKLFVDLANGRPGSFDATPRALQAMFVDNARTLLLPEPPPLNVTCAQLAQLRVPVTITKGELTRPASKVLAEAAHRCIPRSQLLTIPAASHGAPRQNPAAFNDALLRFLAQR